MRWIASSANTVLVVLIAAVVGLASGYGFSRLARVHYRRRWLNATSLIEQLTQEQASQPQASQPQVPIPARVVGRRVVRATQASGPSLPAPTHKTPWRVSARKIGGVTTVIARRGTEVQEIQDVPTGDPDAMAAALERGRRIVEGMNARG